MYCVSSCFFFFLKNVCLRRIVQEVSIYYSSQIFLTDFVLKTCGSIDNYRYVATIFANNSILPFLARVQNSLRISINRRCPNAKLAEFMVRVSTKRFSFLERREKNVSFVPPRIWKLATPSLGQGRRPSGVIVRWWWWWRCSYRVCSRGRTTRYQDRAGTLRQLGPRWRRVVDIRIHSRSERSSRGFTQRAAPLAENCLNMT